MHSIYAHISIAHCNQLPVISHARIQYSAPNGQLSGEDYPVGTKVKFYLHILEHTV